MGVRLFRGAVGVDAFGDLPLGLGPAEKDRTGEGDCIRFLADPFGVETGGLTLGVRIFDGVSFFGDFDLSGVFERLGEPAIVLVVPGISKRNDLSMIVKTSLSCSWIVDFTLWPLTSSTFDFPKLTKNTSPFSFTSRRQCSFPTSGSCILMSQLLLLPNKQDVEVSGKDAPSDPFLFITTMLANNIVVSFSFRKFLVLYVFFDFWTPRE